MSYLAHSPGACQALARSALAAEASPDAPTNARIFTAENHVATRRDVSDVSDSINALLIAIAWDESTRAPLMAAIGFANGRVSEFSAPDKLVGRRMTSDVEGISDPAVAKRWRRGYEHIDLEQRRTGYLLVERIAGGRDNSGENRPSRLRCPVVAHLADIIEQARAMREFKQKRLECFEVAARRVVKAMPRNQERAADPFLRHRPRRDDGSKNTREINTIKALAKNIRSRAARAGASDNQLAELRALLGAAIDEAFADAPLEPVHYKDKMQRTQAASGDETNKPPVSLSSRPENAQDSTTGTGDAPAGVQKRHPENIDVFSDFESAKGEAERTLAAFESVNTASFGVTLRDEERGTVDFQTFTGAELRAMLPGLLRHNEKRHVSIIVRPSAPGLIQLDDLSEAAIEKIAPFAFITVETSPQNFQAWVAVADSDETTRRRLLTVLAADGGASGAMRLPGSRNCKPGRDGFHIRLIAAYLGRTVLVNQLEAANLLAAIPSTRERKQVHERVAPLSQWPDYGRSLIECAGDRSRADWLFSLRASRSGFSEQEVAAKLRTLSGKARVRRDNYAERTARKAANEVAA